MNSYTFGESHLDWWIKGRLCLRRSANCNEIAVFTLPNATGSCNCSTLGCGGADSRDFVDLGRSEHVGHLLPVEDAPAHRAEVHSNLQHGRRARVVIGYQPSLAQRLVSHREKLCHILEGGLGTYCLIMGSLRPRLW